MNLSKKNILILLLFNIIFFLPFSSAAHYIVGQVNDALDSTSANGRIITLWNPANGQVDNITDIIGQTGNSGTDNVYFIDCELLSIPCQIGDTIEVQVLDNGSNYATNYTTTNVTPAGSYLMPTLTLNSPPNIALDYPLNYENMSMINITFNCSATDLDGNLANITLYGNWSNGWHANETRTVSGSFATASFNKTLGEGIYSWSCKAKDDLETNNFAFNNTLVIDLTSTDINSFYSNFTVPMCGVSNQTRITCNVTDSLSGVKNVSISALSPSGILYNYSAQNQIGTQSYYYDINLNETSNWNFTCFAYDYAQNSNTNNISTHVYTTNPDLAIFSSNITLSLPLIESVSTVVKTMISNIGCGPANNFLTGLFEESLLTGTQIGNNQTGSIPAFSNASFSFNWTPQIGQIQLYAYTDISSVVIEDNEISNNRANISALVPSSQDFYGNITIRKILAASSTDSLDAWSNISNYNGNLFVIDSDSQINWLNLQAIGKNSTNGTEANDFSDVDILLNMTSFQDSINISYTNNTNIPLQTNNFTVFNKLIENVPIINSTNNSNFYTGILWDKTKDIDGKFDTVDKEDIVFVTKINKQAIGAYGTYDYEIKIPVKLRQYIPTDITQISFYYDLN